MADFGLQLLVMLVCAVTRAPQTAGLGCMFVVMKLRAIARAIQTADIVMYVLW